jgi:aspartyl protease family protein
MDAPDRDPPSIGDDSGAKQGPPPARPGPPPSRLTYYPESRPSKARQPLSLTARLVSLGTWALVLLLVFAVLQQFQERRLAGLRANLKAEQTASTTPEPPAEEAPEPEAEAAEPETSPAAYAPDLSPPVAAPPEAAASAEAKPQLAEVVITASPNGNFYVRGEINQNKVLFVVDTGASYVSIPDKLRWTLKLNKGNYVQSATANGVAGMYQTRVDSLNIGPIRLSNIDAVLLSTPMPNDVVLLGMSALRQMRLLHQEGQLILQKEMTAQGDATAAAPARPTALKKSIKDCMGQDKVVNERVLKCMKGDEEEAAPEDGEPETP